jgi:hypothetical protein
MGLRGSGFIIPLKALADRPGPATHVASRGTICLNTFKRPASGQEYPDSQ